MLDKIPSQLHLNQPRSDQASQNLGSATCARATQTEERQILWDSLRTTLAYGNPSFIYSLR